jgi:hypothetical protein
MITFGYCLNFEPGKQLPVLLRNFHAPEDGFIWSLSKWCEIVFPFTHGKGSTSSTSDLLLDFDVFKAPPKLASQAVMIYLNGLRIGQYDIAYQDTRVFSIPTALLKDSDNSLTIDTPDASSPSDYFETDDERTLGIQLFSVQIQRA